MHEGLQGRGRSPSERLTAISALTIAPPYGRVATWWGRLLQAIEIILRSAVATAGSTAATNSCWACSGAAALSAAGFPKTHLLT